MVEKVVDVEREVAANVIEDVVGAGASVVVIGTVVGAGVDDSVSVFGCLF